MDYTQTANVLHFMSKNAQYMGKIDMVPFLGGFNYYMPYVILVPTLVTLFNVFAKMFAVCSISDNFFDNDDEDGGIGGDLEEGLQVLKDGKPHWRSDGYAVLSSNLITGSLIVYAPLWPHSAP